MYKNRGRSACELAGFEVIRFGGVMGVRIGHKGWAIDGGSGAVKRPGQAHIANAGSRTETRPGPVSGSQEHLFSQTNPDAAPIAADVPDDRQGRGVAACPGGAKNPGRND